MVERPASDRWLVSMDRPPKKRGEPPGTIYPSLGNGIQGIV